MKSITLIITTITMAASLTGCMSYYTLNQKNSTLFNTEQMKLLKKTTKAIDFDYGYDIKTELVYIISYKHSKPEKKQAQFISILKNINKKSLLEFYKKIFKLNSETLYKLREYKKDKTWNNYTYIKKYLYPSLKTYTSFLENYIKTVDKSILGNDALKIAINKEVDKEMLAQKKRRQRVMLKAGKR